MVEHRCQHPGRARYLELRHAVKNIIVVGYPKSGCTWATRLVAELVGCPVGGFWQSDKKEIAIEGEDRISDYRCYKSHHQLAELEVQPNEPETWIIYILRDPRDIAISGASYFQFDRFPKLAALFRSVRRGEKLYRHTLYPLLVRQDYRLEQMTEALLHGSAAVHNRSAFPGAIIGGLTSGRACRSCVTKTCSRRRRNKLAASCAISGLSERRSRSRPRYKTNRSNAKRKRFCARVKPAGRNFSASGKAGSGARSCPRFCSNDSSENSAENWRSGAIPPKESTRRCPEPQVAGQALRLPPLLPGRRERAFTIHFGGDAPCSSNL